MFRITAVNSALTKAHYSFLGSTASTQELSLPNDWREIIIQVEYSSTLLTSIFTRSMVMDNAYFNVSLGNYGTSYALGQLSRQKYRLSALNWAGGDQTSSAHSYVYGR